MTKVKLIKGLSYKGIISATKQKPFVEVDDKNVKEVLATGYFEVVEETAEEEKLLEDMKVAELDAYAEENGIDLGEAKNKAEKIETIKNAEV